jgi:hypothetical protein
MAESPTLSPGLYVGPSGEPVSDLQQPGEPYRGYELPPGYGPQDQELSDQQRHTFSPLNEVFPNGVTIPHEPAVGDVVASGILRSPGGDLVYNSQVIQQYMHSPDRSSFARRDAVIELDEDQVRQLVIDLCLPRDEQGYKEAREQEAKSYAADPRMHELSYGPRRYTADTYDTFLETHLAQTVTEVLRGEYRDYTASPRIDKIIQPSKRRAFEAAVLERPEEYIDLCENALFADFSETRLAALESVSELFELDDGKHPMYLANLSEWKMSKEQLGQIVNAVRSVADESSGTLSKTTRVVTILPEHHPLFLTQGPEQNGRDTVILSRGIYWGRDTVGISDYFLKPSEARLPLPDNLYYEPPAEGEKREFHTPDFLPNEGEAHALEIVTYHELMHALLRAKRLAQQFEQMIGDEPPHVQYGDGSTGEDMSETAASMHVGGAAAEAIGSEHVAAALRVLGEVRQQGIDTRRSMPEELQDNDEYQEGTADVELGPRFIRVRQITLDSPERFCPKPTRLAILAENIRVELVKS